jgi:hypothetical protein
MKYDAPKQPGQRPSAVRPGSPAPRPPGTRAPRPAPRPNSRWMLGCGMFFFGFLVAALIGAVAVFFLYFYDPGISSAPLPRPTQVAGTPDLTATLSQTYLNKEISQQINGKTSQAGPVQIRDIVVTIQADSLLDITVRASSGPFGFEMGLTERIYVQNGQIKLEAVGQPKVMSGQLPPSVNTILDAINNFFIIPQINQQIADIKVKDRAVNLLELTTTPGFITVKANVIITNR